MKAFNNSYLFLISLQWSEDIYKLTTEKKVALIVSLLMT